MFREEELARIDENKHQQEPAFLALSFLGPFRGSEGRGADKATGEG